MSADMYSGNEQSISPVTEVYLYERKESIRNEITRRRNNALTNLVSSQQTRMNVLANTVQPVMNLVSSEESDSGDTTYDYDSDVCDCGC